MISRLRFPTGGSTNNNGNSSSSTSSSIFSAMSQISSGSLLPGNSAESAAASAAAAHAASSSSSGATAGGAAGASGTAPDGLPPGWRLVSSRNSGRDYYLHLASGQTQWDKPTEAEPKRRVYVSRLPSARAHGSSRTDTYARCLYLGLLLYEGTEAPALSKSGTGGFFAATRMAGLVNQVSKQLQTSLQNTVTGPAGKAGSGSSRGSQEVIRDGQVLVEIFENERLEGKLQPMDPKRFSDRHAAPGAGQDTQPEGDLPADNEWASEWEIDQNYTAVDRDGWTYAAEFVEIVRLLGDDLSHASRHPTDAVRRRRWIRYRQPIDENAPQVSTEAASGSKSVATSSASTNWASESTNGQGLDSGYELDENDDPFQRTAQKTQTGFRVNVNFSHRRTKDNTKDYQSVNLADVMWLVNAHDVDQAPTDELMREKTANLEEQIKEATMRSKGLEKDLRTQHDKQTRELTMQQKKFEALVAQYKKIQLENETLQGSVSEHRGSVEALRKEATEKDMLANEEQRALNAETAAQNQALEEKAKALATARMRYKRDNKQLAAAVEDAKKRLEQHKAQANVDLQDPVAKELKTEMEKVRQLHAKLEAVRQHRLVVEEESKALFNQVVEKKADLKFKSKKKMETALSEVDAKIKTLKEEQAAVSKSLAQKPQGEELRKINARRNDIRSELGALKERRTMLLAEKRKQEGVEL